MRCYPLLCLFCLLIVESTGCTKQKTTQRSTKQESNQAEFNACALITTQEIEAIQGSHIKDTKNSVHSDAGFRVFQCFYTADNFSESVSLAVTQRDPTSSDKPSVRDFWNEKFGRITDAEQGSNADNEKRDRVDQDRRGGEERTFMAAKKIDGVGDAAVWSPNPAGGAVYVLKKDIFIRISIGGRDNEQAKLDKSKALARKAIDRL